MATPFAEAITASMIAGLDPMNGVIKSYATQQVQRADLDLDTERLELMAKIESRLQSPNLSEASKRAYAKMLEKYLQSIS